jgi:anionic cell wall polymer biosynthesis LytR-Cps2A-Psr (LCP) family protein
MNPLFKKKVTLFDVPDNKYVEFPEWNAKHRLQYNHFSKGGRYMTVDEVQKNIQVPPPPPKPVKQKAEIVVETKKQEA